MNGMKTAVLTLGVIVVGGATLGTVLNAAVDGVSFREMWNKEIDILKPVFARQDTQVAAGEWKIQVQTPPCDSYRNLQVIYPKESGGPITIECDLMPVNAK